jgi:hypothetical protein
VLAASPASVEDDSLFVASANNFPPSDLRMIDATGALFSPSSARHDHDSLG